MPFLPPPSYLTNDLQKLTPPYFYKNAYIYICHFPFLCLSVFQRLFHWEGFFLYTLYYMQSIIVGLWSIFRDYFSS